MTIRILIGLVFLMLADKLISQELYYVKRVEVDQNGPSGWVWEQGGTLSLSIITPVSVHRYDKEKVSLSSRLPISMPFLYKDRSLEVNSNWNLNRSLNSIASKVSMNYGLHPSGKINVIYNQVVNTNKLPVHQSLIFQSIAVSYTYTLLK